MDYQQNPEASRHCPNAMPTLLAVLDLVGQDDVQRVGKDKRSE